MNSTEFAATLSTEQSSALNAMLIEQRDTINAMRDDAMLPLATRATDAEARAESAKAGLTALQDRFTQIIASVKSAYDANDIPAMLLIAAEFVTPEQEKDRLADLAQAADLESQAAGLRAKYAEDATLTDSAKALDLRVQAAAAFGELPEQVQQMFGPLFQALSALPNLSDAAKALSAVTVGEEYQPYKDAFVSLLTVK